MMKFFTQMVLLFVSLTVTLGGCTKNAGNNEPIPAGAIQSNVGDPNQLIVDTEIDLPVRLRKKARALDTLIWDVKDSSGAIVAIGMLPVEKFPIRLQVKARDLVRPLDPKSPIAVYARLAQAGDESKPPKKGQFVGFMGSASGKLSEVVVPEKISKKILSKIEDQLGLSAKFKRVAIGDRAKITLEPYQF